ncbi:MAG: NAD(P)-dependent glycerol-3-phosphate dehydrogenase [Coriobacteriales bacterium]|jgi:glycerol-3-phosphate dehydrogenase (NAD(P)+)|nr:NAD(P)-dependent glycerol-3-phosphate dehydrogenase [Coriobacteriales bacterium]
MNVTVIGAGSWGTAAAIQLALGGHKVLLWARRAELARRIEAERVNEDYLPGVLLPEDLTTTSSLEHAAEKADAMVLATPSKAVRATCELLKSSYRAGTPLLLLSKGIENSSGLFLLDVMDEILASRHHQAVLSGPNHAEEIARSMFSATVVAAEEPEVARLFQELFASEHFRVYTTDDTSGVQICGAAKNIIAIATGIAAGSGYGDNTAAMLMTRGLAEISRLVAARGGTSQTCMGLAGMGDLIVTCTSRHSRNRSFGEALAAGDTLASYEARTHMVVEGALASQSVVLLAHRSHVELPICEMVRRAVWEGLTLDEMIPLLMMRPAKPEFY